MLFRSSPSLMHEAGHSKPVHWDNPEGKDGGAFRMRAYVHPWLIHVNLWQTPPKYCTPPLTFHTLCHTPHSWQKEPLLPRLHPQPIRSAKPPLPAPRLGSCHITRVLSHWTSLQAGCPFIIRCPGSLLGTPCMKPPPQVPAQFLLLRRASLLWKQPLPMDRDREIGI